MSRCHAFPCHAFRDIDDNESKAYHEEAPLYRVLLKTGNRAKAASDYRFRAKYKTKACLRGEATEQDENVSGAARNAWEGQVGLFGQSQMERWGPCMRPRVGELINHTVFRAGKGMPAMSADSNFPCSCVTM